MHKSTKVVAAAFVCAVAAAALVASPGSAESLPSSKAAMAIDNLIDLSQTASGASRTNSAGDTGWVDVLQSQIKTSSQKDLLFDVAIPDPAAIRALMR